MPGNSALFEYHYVYRNPKMHPIITDCYNKFGIVPVVNNRGIITSHEVRIYNKIDPGVKFRSQKKAMQYVVAELFNEFFGYE